ncbi:uncharacterized protein LOC116413587 [Galleria mellonella]|uniref:Uncharacterized protein LOC116413587 n=1 Tax=Galleria mellonella TaxID=7137 RepID=A0ABM3MG47_GALME|nr:uncharacterized protein LOC116413587 [Galleria mellonella]
MFVKVYVIFSILAISYCQDGHHTYSHSIVIKHEVAKKVQPHYQVSPSIPSLSLSLQDVSQNIHTVPYQSLSKNPDVNEQPQKSLQQYFIPAPNREPAPVYEPSSEPQPQRKVLHVPIRNSIQGIAVQHVPIQQVPVQHISVQQVPVQLTPVQSIPVQQVPIQHVQIPQVPIQIKHVPIQSVAVEHIPVHHTPVEHVQQVSVQQVGAVQHQEGESDHHEDYYAYPKYVFEYKVEDPHTGDNKYQHESRDGDVVKGVYSLHEADGSIRTVEYGSDKKTGFNAYVQNSGVTRHLEPEHHNHH